MIGNDFIFRDKYLSDFEMKLYDPDDPQEFAEREVERSEITSARSIPNHYSTKYSDVQILSLLIMKDDCLYPNQEDMRLTGEEIHNLRAWLESPKMPTHLLIRSDDDPINVNYYGVFTSVQPYVEEGECYGLYLTFTCNAPFAFSDDVVGVYQIDSETRSEVYTNYSSEECDYLSPIIHIEASSSFGGSETFSITNTSDSDKKMELKMPPGVTAIDIDCRKRTITDQNGKSIPLKELGIEALDLDAYNPMSVEQYLFYWLRFAPGYNYIDITASPPDSFSQVTITTNYEIKTGGYAI